ncbi:arginyl-tRNA synthetase [Candidatus Magnetobacterium bavaricum]|uniref:Arginine--tRNA ligase n=1 Tax=Candidatus Magnetobacterium bavaricum TaxID=29290 RepID=A0A0F3GHW9_9BACT|nr:arginyl-tRNA synthetase [Candidatus Magnetobacterium bavaricum]
MKDMTTLTLIGHLTMLFSKAFESLGFDAKFGQVVTSDRPDLGQFQCNGALSAAKIHKKNPRDIAQMIIEALEKKEIFSSLSVAGAGFININLSDDFLTTYIRQMSADERLCCPVVSRPEHVIIDFGGPNVAKPMHVGHLRSTIIGDSLQRLFRFLGHQVTSDIHLGDWGLQMGMLITELKTRNPELPYFNASHTGSYPQELSITINDLEEMYPVASMRCKSNKTDMEAAQRATLELQQLNPGYYALWRQFVLISIQELKKDFESLCVTFDLWRGESYYNDRLPPLIAELKAKGYIQDSEGALVIPVTNHTDKKEIPPLILVKSDGGYLYGTTDLATIEERIKDLHADIILYVVDKRQALHFEQVFRSARLISLASGIELEHIAFGTMCGTDGKPFKTRAGGVMKLKELICMVTEKVLTRMEENDIAKMYDITERESIAKKVAIATLKFADLSNHRTSDYVFDLERFSKFEGKTGPYLLYTAVRIKSILCKAEEKNIYPGSILPPTLVIEGDLMLSLCRLPETIIISYIERTPHYLCDFIYDLSQIFSRFYLQCHILSEKDPALQSSWLALSKLCLREIELVLHLLGIDIPQRM